MDTRPLITKERLAAIQALRDSTGGYAEVAAGLTQLNSPSVEDYIRDRIEPAPPPPPPPSQAYLDALAKERRRDEHLAELFKRLDGPGDIFQNSNPYEHRAVKHLAENPDTMLARQIAEQLYQDGDLPGAEYEAAVSLIAEREAEDADFEKFSEQHLQEKEKNE